MGLMTFIKLGYTIVVVAFVLMIWASLSRALEMHTESAHPPCLFQALCTCSKPAGDLGVVECTDVPVLRVPAPINSSKVFTLQMTRNKIRQLDPHFFQSTGLYKLSINENPLEYIHDDAFIGLENSLWELELRKDLLTNVPRRSLRYLQKLKVLDLSGNEISEISADDWRGLETTLQILILAENSITNIPTDAFHSLPVLDTLDLHGNHLSRIDPNVFRDGMHRLTKLLLQDNQLSYIPYEEISPLRQLRYLDLSSNVIRQVQPQHEITFKLNLDYIKLDSNLIDILVPKAFRNFEVVNYTSLDGNPIQIIRDDAFRNSRIRTLSLRDCNLMEISPAAFSGLENYLQSLDLSENNLTDISRTMLHQFEALRVLDLRENRVNISPLDRYGRYQSKLFYLDVSGTTASTVHLQDMRRMRSLRYLSVSRLFHKSLTFDDFLEYGVDLEDLKIIGGGVVKIGANAFQNVRTIKTLDLSENEIEFLDRDAFQELHSLTTLKISHGFATHLKVLPYEALKALIVLQNLDLSNNRLRNVPDTSFHFLTKLKVLKLHDNAIEVFSKGTLQGDIHSELETITLSQNKLRQIIQHTFVDLRELKEIYMEDNLLEVIQRRAFMNLDNLKLIRMTGNKIYEITEEAFQNLPSLQELDISYNELKTFKFTIFDQVGSATSLKVNASHNQIMHLADSMAPSFLPARSQNIGSVAVNIRVLDFSFNNISFIAPYYFRHAQLTLTELHLSHNQLRNVSREVFGSMPQLQYVDLSFNHIVELEFDCFKRTTGLQIIDLSHNSIYDVPLDMFREMPHLLQVDLSHNRITALPDQLFPAAGLERLDISFNELSRIPTNALTVPAASTLIDLDLRSNQIPAIAIQDLLNKFKNGDSDWLEDEFHDDYSYHTARRDHNKLYHQKKPLDQNSLYKSLVWLDLSSNHLVRVEGGTFGALPNLRHLDLSNNAPLNADRGQTVFRGLEKKLTHLSLRNCTLNTLPSLPFTKLQSLDLSYNNLPSFPTEIASNLTRLKRLDLSWNDLTAVPVATHALTELNWLSLSSNPITSLANTSLYGVSAKLEYLDITKLNLRALEYGILSKMQSLRTLKISTYDRISHFNIPRLVRNNLGLKNLLIEVMDGDNLSKVMRGVFPNKMYNLTLTGRSLRYIPENVLKGVTSRNFHLTVEHSNLKDVDEEIFWRPGSIRNITLDLRHNQIRRLPNPTSKSPGVPRKVFLVDVLLEDNQLECDCGVGWIEAWERTRRQYSCLSNKKCLSQRNDLRLARCPSKYNRTLSDVLKTELECGFSFSTILSPHNMMICGLVLATLLYI